MEIPAGHTLEKTDAVEPTTEKAGNIAYWKCTVCGKYFSDENGTTGIDENAWIRRLKGTITAESLTIPADSGSKVGERLNSLISDWTLKYNGEYIDAEKIILSSAVDLELDSMSNEVPSAPFQVTVEFKPEKSDIYESVTESFNVTITQAVSTES